MGRKRRTDLGASSGAPVSVDPHAPVTATMEVPMVAPQEGEYVTDYVTNFPLYKDQPRGLKALTEGLRRRGDKVTKLHGTGKVPVNGSADALRWVCENVGEMLGPR